MCILYYTSGFGVKGGVDLLLLWDEKEVLSSKGSLGSWKGFL